MNFASLSANCIRQRAALLALLAMGGVYFFSYFQRVAVPGTIFNELQTAYQASAGAIAALGSIFLYIYGGLQLFTGLAVDRWGGARILLAGGLLMSLGALWFPLTYSLPALYASRVLVGLGASVIFISIVKEIDTLFAARHFALVLCAVLGIGYAGGLGGTFPFERLSAGLGWRSALLLAGAICAAAGLGAAILLRRTGRLRGSPAPPTRLDLKDILRNRATYPVILSGAINFGVFFIWQAVFGKKMLTDICGLASAAAAAATFYMMLSSMFFSTAAGFLSRLMGNRRKPLILAAVALTLIAVSLMRFNLAGPSAAFWMQAGFLMLGASSSASVMFCCAMKELNPERAAGASVGLSNSTAYLAIAAMVNGGGFLMDRFKDQAVATASALIYPAAAYRAILLLCLVLAAISCVSAIFIRESRGVCVYRA